MFTYIVSAFYIARTVFYIYYSPETIYGISDPPASWKDDQDFLRVIDLYFSSLVFLATGFGIGHRTIEKFSYKGISNAMLIVPFVAVVLIYLLQYIFGDKTVISWVVILHSMFLVYSITLPLQLIFKFSSFLDSWQVSILLSVAFLVFMAILDSLKANEMMFELLRPIPFYLIMFFMEWKSRLSSNQLRGRIV